MVESSPISQLVHAVVRLECFDAAGRPSYGSGYFMRFCESEKGHMPCIVTNKHVVKDAVKGRFHLTVKKEDGNPDIGVHDAIDLHDLQKWVVRHPKADVDLVAIPLAPILRHAVAAGKKYYYLSIGKENIADEALLASLSPMEDIVMLGYPSGLWDAKHNMPIIRRGITATHARLPLNGKPEFLIDAACFPGSSGSPVFLSNLGGYATSTGGFAIGNRVALLGTLYAGPQFTTEGEIVTVEVPTDTKSFSVGTIPMNLGFVIHAAELLQLEEQVLKMHEASLVLPLSRPIPLRNPIPSRNSPCLCSSGKRFKECCGKVG